MARIRTIKPEFFTSADIVSLDPLARLFYIALWCEADKAGRLKWDARTLKYRYLPGDDCDIEEIADELIDAGLIAIYEAGGKTYCEIPSFQKHQVINNRERDSELPARDSDASFTRESGRKGREGKEGNNSNPNGLLVDDESSPCDCEAEKPETPDCPHQEIINLYHEHCPTLPKIKTWGPDRQKFLRSRWRESPKHQSLAFWERFFKYAADSPFLRGEINGFQADLEFLVRPKGFRRVIEGYYHRERN